MTFSTDTNAFETAQRIAATTMAHFIESLATLGAEFARRVTEPNDSTDIVMSDSEAPDAASDPSQDESLYGPLITNDPDLELYIRDLLRGAFLRAVRSHARNENLDTDRLFAFLNDHLSGLIRQSFHPVLLRS